MSLVDYFKENFPKLRESRNQLRFECPFCKHRGKTFAVYIETFSVHCFYAECLYHKSVMQFIMDFEGLTYSEAFLRLKEYQRSFILPQKEHRDLTLSEHEGKFMSLSEIKKPYPLSARNSLLYLTKRCVTLEQIEKYRLGYRLDVRGQVQIVFPIYDIENKLRAWIERTLTGIYRVYPLGINKGHLFFGLQIAKGYQTIVLCEGAFDVFAIGENALGILGKSLSDMQFAQLLALKPKRNFIIVLDGDANKEAFRIVFKLSKYREVKVLMLDSKVDPADVRKSIQSKIVKESKSIGDFYSEKIKITCN